MPQFFKGDAQEKRFHNSVNPIVTALEGGKNDFYDQAYECFILGEVLYDTGRAPLANSIPREIFRESFSVIFESFLFAGSFESYLSTFRNVFGEDVEVTFTVPGPGQLNIDIVATGLALFDFMAKRIEDDSYVLDEVIDDEGDNIAFQAVKGFETQYELEQMLQEMVPAGIYADIDLTVGV
jgi:hypothetical protein